MNEVRIEGQIGSREPLTYLLSGFAVSCFTLDYQGKVKEAGFERKLKFTVECRAVGETAEKLNELPLETKIAAKGFLATSSSRAKKLLLHITEYEIGV